MGHIFVTAVSTTKVLRKSQIHSSVVICIAARSMLNRGGQAWCAHKHKVPCVTCDPLSVSYAFVLLAYVWIALACTNSEWSVQSPHVWHTNQSSFCDTRRLCFSTTKITSPEPLFNAFSSFVSPLALTTNSNCIPDVAISGRPLFRVSVVRR